MEEGSYGTGLTTDEMTNHKEKYVGWDFNGVWIWTDGEYPKLQ